jgi:peptidoglycan glycosyltransferase
MFPTTTIRTFFPPKRECSLIYSLLFVLSLTGCKESVANDQLSEGGDQLLPQVPVFMPPSVDRGKLVDGIYLQSPDDKPLKTTIVPKIQHALRQYIRHRGNPIAAVVLADVKSGKILAMTQGMDPKKWGATTHSALHTEFPAASLFKTVTAAAAFEFTDMRSREPIGITGGCANIHPGGHWMKSRISRKVNRMNLSRAYGHSCNGFFAKIAVNNIGLGNILEMSQRFGWAGSPVTYDFNVKDSPINTPNPTSSSAQTVGRFAAGFGYVGISAVHAAWQALVIASNGKDRALQLFERESFPQGDGTTIDQAPNNPLQQPKSLLESRQIISELSAKKVRDIMRSTILGGTASFAFRHGKPRKLRRQVGGKTGTLTGHFPEGLTTWFVGMAPIEKPQVVVASVVVLEDLWIFKAPSLAAEALVHYFAYEKEVSVAAAKRKAEESATAH